MDAIKKAVGGNHGSSNTQSHTGGSSGGQDFGDKGAAAANQKLGGHLNNNQLEKGTDAGRNMFEKKTGTHVPSKISN
ncbi:hypothetical protein GGS20DRAFT_557653 [Poronia punctata]|nr:hypothetical protein GGS20DRAFT_557653 [Poronia punctata]